MKVELRDHIQINSRQENEKQIKDTVCSSICFYNTTEVKAMQPLNSGFFNKLIFNNLEQ